MTVADRAAQAWQSRCSYGNLGNRVTCPCVQCGAWRGREARRLDALTAAAQTRAQARARKRGPA